MERIEYNVSTGISQIIQLTQAEIDALPIETIQEKQRTLESDVQKYLDDQAKLKGYDSILSACSYAAAPNIFQIEGQSFLTWRAACWAYCYQVQDLVQAGAIPMPTAEQLISQLPTRV